MDRTTRSGVAALTFLLPLTLVPWTNADDDRAAEARKLFLAVETVSRLEKEEQERHIQKLYEEILPRLRSLDVVGLPERTGPLIPQQRSWYSPEELAERIMAHGDGGWPWLIVEGTSLCLDILKKNHASLVPCVKADMESKKEANMKRALLVIGDLGLVGFFEPVLHVFETDAVLSERASYALRDIDDPRAIAPMVKKCPDLRGHYTVLAFLRRLQAGKKADPSLLGLLDSKDPEVRCRAAYALAESGDPRLIPHIERLANDKDAEVREYASNMGFCMEGGEFEKVRPVLVSMLADSSMRVRSITARCFAQRKDMVCARTLFELLKDTSMDKLKQHDIVQGIHSLTGSYFGYYSDACEPTTTNKKKAIRRFADWVEKNAANQRLHTDGQGRR